MKIEIDIDNYLVMSDVLELCDEFGIITGSVPDCFEQIEFDKLSMNDISKIELFLEKFEDIDLATFEKFFYDNQ